MVDHDDDEGEEARAGQAPPSAAPAKWDPLAPSSDPDVPPSEGLGEGERVAKALARAGVASRREVERYIEAGRVALNGKVLDTPAVKVAPGDILTVDGAVVGGPEPTRLFRYHKPSGLITTNSDPQGRPTVFEHLPDGLPRVLAVGRLDLNTEGLLLLTNDGALSRALELPSSGWVRRYRARAYGRIDQARLDTLAEGVTVDGVAYGPIEARLDKATGHDRESGAANVWISVGITEGKNREVRKVLEHLGLKVNRLIRLAYGPFALSTLEVGQVEEVGPRVIREQLAEYVAPENLPTGDRVAAPVLSAPRPRAEMAPRRPAAPPAPPRSTGRDAPGRKGADRRPPAEGAERRLAEAPRKGGRQGPPGAKGRPAPDRKAAAGSAKPKRLGDRGEGRGVPPARGWIDKPPGYRGRGDGDARARDARSEGARPQGARPQDARPQDARPKDARPKDARPRDAKPRDGDRASAGRGPGKPGGADPPRASRAFDKPGHSGPRPAARPGQKAGARPASKSGGAKPDAAGANRTGLELTPPMRRTPRGSGPRRPTRKD